MHIHNIIFWDFFFPFSDQSNTSEVFDDDSFFSESILLSTQALEQEALGSDAQPQNGIKVPNSVMTPTSSSPQSSTLQSFEENSLQRSFDFGDESDVRRSIRPIATKGKLSSKSFLLMIYC